MYDYIGSLCCFKLYIIAGPYNALCTVFIKLNNNIILTLTIVNRMEVVSVATDQRQHVGELRSTKMPRRVPRKVDDRRAAYVAGQQHDHH